MGGLGNQMFQYAFARHLSVKNNFELKLDVSLLNNETLGEKFTIRDLGLSHFNIKPVFANDLELERYNKSKFSKILDLIYLNLPFKINSLYIREPSFTFYRKALDAPKDCCLDGYWQSEKYFIDIRKQLLRDFAITSELSLETNQLADKIKSEQAVSIHVRRGDYITVKENQDLYAACSENYYIEAMNKIKENDAVFYVFSDEPEWFKENIKSNKNVHYVTHNTGKYAYQDLYLMSLCKHNIIANSSFSWWGAWLNQNPNKMVIAPKHWFKNNYRDTRDLIPHSWIQL